MLLDLRETVRNSKPIKYTLITLICIPFVLFGIGSYFSGGEAPPVATVNGADITQYELDAATQQQRRQLAQMFGGQLPEAFSNEQVLRQQALDQLVTRRVLEETVARERFAVGDETLGRMIRNRPAFQLNGAFDRETYDQQLRASGLSHAAFEQSFRDDTAVNQFSEGVINTSFTLPNEAELISQLARQVRTVDALRFDLEAARTDVEPSEEDIQAHFDENADSYTFPERVKIDWLELSADKLAEGIDVTDAEAQTRYEDNIGNYMRPEQRAASHILLETDGDVDDKIAELEAVRERLNAGESFADLAAEISNDVGSAENGGSLGAIAPGSMSGPFEDALFALENEGDVSEPVQTDFGVHLIKLDTLTPESGKPFEEVREDILATLRSEQADREFFDLRTELTEIVFDESTSLEPAADATGLEVISSDWLDADTIQDAGPVLSNPAILAAANDPEVLEAGNNSDLIDVGTRHVVALRVVESEGPRPKSLDDVREQVIEEIRSARAGERLDELAASAEEALQGDGDVAALADAEPLAEGFAAEPLDRQSTVFDNGVIATIFALPRPAEGAAQTGVATLSDGDRLVYALRSVESPAAEGTDTESTAPMGMAASIQDGADPQRGGVEFNALLGSLRERADVDLEL